MEGQCERKGQRALRQCTGSGRAFGRLCSKMGEHRAGGTDSVEHLVVGQIAVGHLAVGPIAVGRSHVEQWGTLAEKQIGSKAEEH